MASKSWIYFRTQIGHDVHLHPAQEEEVHPPQPEPLSEEDNADPLDDRPMPNRDIRFSVFSEPHFSQVTIGAVPKTSFSKSASHTVQ